MATESQERAGIQNHSRGQVPVPERIQNQCTAIESLVRKPLDASEQGPEVAEWE